MCDLSLFFFSNYEVDANNKYELLLECVKYADQNGFAAVWTPERHFHEFGGLFPNPSVVSAALAMITENITLRSGSVVSPLHDVIRIAEEWSVVDNLSKGRIALSFASGWNGHDFVLAKDNFRNRHEIMYEQIATLKHLWNGGTVQRENGVGKEITIRMFPEPYNKDLPVWITASRHDETFIRAGEIGANLLTHMLGQEIAELSRKIGLYRDARRRNGFDPAAGKVAVMLHTFVHDDEDFVMNTVSEPFLNYLKSSADLDKFLYEDAGQTREQLSPEVQEEMLRAYMLYYISQASLIGTTDHATEMMSKLADAGVNEIACLIDFGIDPALVLAGLRNLKVLNGALQAS
ncbi:MupA/Atu3671 family FMN-dependent luciferase-like monooxygenase [Chitinophaga sp.]|uniref:MupA/Atu3671 family FMN-dependent luciferase-like monooxygenase n=1 Tax=Chitinophaga sp. TaxID=1869181 RepID=UPI002F935175